VLVYRGILDPNAAGKQRTFRRTFEKNGWVGVWTDVIFDYVHFHSNAHEVLGIARGHVIIELGGEGGRRLRLKSGDMMILPAGIGHRRLYMDEDLTVVGGYPPGQSNYDMKREGQTIRKVPVPRTDPFYGHEGPLLRAWKQASLANRDGHKH
jgi:uncharacterized protein YjlB